MKIWQRTRVQEIVRLWRNPLEIKLAIHETLGEFSRRDELIGWIPGDQAVNSGAVAEEIARLAKENSSLRERLSGQTERTYCGLSFDEMSQLLRSEKVDVSKLPAPSGQQMQECVARYNDLGPAFFHVLCIYEGALAAERGLGQRMITNFSLWTNFVDLESLYCTRRWDSVLPTRVGDSCSA